MIIKYKLTKLLEGLEMVSTDTSIYMHKETLAFIMITDESISTYEKYISGEINDLLDWEINMVKEMDDVLNRHEDDYIKLPDSYFLHDHKIMEHFTYTLPEHLREDFLMAIFKKGAFRIFHELLIQHHLREQFFEYKRKAYLEKLVVWCEMQGIECE
jgi:hypothetical protein